MRYFDLADDVSIPGRWHLGEAMSNGSSISDSLWDGRRAEGASNVVVEVDREGRELDFCLTSFAVPVVRTSLAAIIEKKAPADIQRIPVKIASHPGFEVVNAVRVITCLDESRSEFAKWTTSDHRPDLAGQYRMVTTLRILPEQVPNETDIFRVGGWLVALVVSERLKDTMEAAGCVGATFVEVT